MNIHQMEYFHVVAKIGNMTKAAEYLQIAQPALSSAIARMSEEIGYPLFVKQGRKIVLSSHGKILLSHVEKILQEYNAAMDEIQEADIQSQKTLCLGVTGTSFSRNYQKGFHEAYPNVTIRQTLVPSSKIISVIKNTPEIDFVLSSTEVVDPEIASFIIEYEPLYLVVSSEHPLASRPSIALSETKYEKFLSFPSVSVSRKIFVELCNKAGFVPNIVMACYPSQFPSLIEENLGIALINRTAIQSGIYNHGCRILPVTEPKCVRPISLLWLKDKKQSVVAKQFQEFLQFNFCKQQSGIS